MSTLYNRDGLHKYLIEIAAKSPAKKRKVGAVIVKINHPLNGSEPNYEIISEGYNHNMDTKITRCEDENGDTLDSVVHAEQHCLNRLPNNFNSKISHHMFVTHEPCDGCKAAILADNMTYEVMGDFMKFDSKKPRFALVPTSLIEGVAKVLTYGAKKYKVNNWRKTPDIESYISAMERHMTAWKNGEDTDPESGLHHLEHAACNLAFLIELKHLPKIKE